MRLRATAILVTLLLGLCTAGTTGTACTAGTPGTSVVSAQGQGRLTARPGVRPTPQAVTAGARPLGLGDGPDGRDGIVYVPSGSLPARLPLVVLLHGAGSGRSRQLDRFRAALDTAGVAALIPDSRGTTWDVIQWGFGRDVAFLDRALERTFEMIPVDPDRLAIGGFSDGATYALTLGLINGDLFKSIVAFSPGSVFDGPPNGTPRIFISHGTTDDILPIQQASRVIVPALQKRGYAVTYQEFTGGHVVPETLALEGIRWMMAAPGAKPAAR